MHDEVAAFCFDKAVSLFGVSLENDITTATGKAKPEQHARIAEGVIASWMSPRRTRASGFKDPARTSF